jgi:hypothetical protein
MKLYAFLTGTFMLFNLVYGSDARAQSKAQQGSADASPAKRSFVSEPILLENPDGVVVRHTGAASITCPGSGRPIHNWIGTNRSRRELTDV